MILVGGRKSKLVYIFDKNWEEIAVLTNCCPDFSLRTSDLFLSNFISLQKLDGMLGARALTLSK